MKLLPFIVIFGFCACDGIHALQQAASVPIYEQARQQKQYIHQLRKYSSLAKLIILPLCAVACFAVGHCIKYATSSTKIMTDSPLMYAVTVIKKFIPPTISPTVQMACFITGSVLFLIYVNYLLCRVSNLRTTYNDSVAQWLAKGNFLTTTLGETCRANQEFQRLEVQADQIGEAHQDITLEKQALTDGLESLQTEFDTIRRLSWDF